MDYAKFFERKPCVMSGEVVMTGTRVPLRVVLGCLQVGDTPEEILREFPTLTKEHVAAAIAWAAAAAVDDEPVLTAAT